MEGRPRKHRNRSPLGQSFDSLRGQDIVHSDTRHTKKTSNQIDRYRQGLIYRARALKALRGGRFEQAISHLESAISLVGTDASLTSLLCRLYATKGDMSACSREAERLAQIDPDSPQSCRLNAQALWRAGRRLDAHMALVSGLRRFGDNAELHVQAGLFHSAEGHYQQAERELESAISADCSLAKAYEYLGMVKAARGDLAGAVGSMQRAFELKGSDLRLAWRLAGYSRLAEKAGVKITLQLPSVRITLADTQVRQMAGYVTANTDLIEAILSLPPSSVDDELFGMLWTVLETAIKDHGDYADLRLRAAEVLERLGRFDDSVSQVRIAVRLNPCYVKGHLLLGRLLMRTGAIEQAGEHVRTAIELGADWPDVHTLAAKLMLTQNRRDHARMHLRRALELKSDYAPAVRILDRLVA